MDHAQYVVRAAPAVAPGAQRISIECTHGRSFGLVLAGRVALPDPIALDLLAARHGGTYRCRCSDVLLPKDPTAPLTVADGHPSAGTGLSMPAIHVDAPADYT
jgi:hypothetical protein